MRIEGWNVGRQFGDRERQIARHPHEGAHTHDLTVVGAACGLGHADHLTLGIDFASRGQPVALAWTGAQPITERADRAAQRRPDPLRHGSEIGIAAERRKNSAAHKGSAAKTRQDGT